MKVLNYISSSKRLFVPIHEFQFTGFAAQVRHLPSRPPRALRNAVRATGRIKRLWAMSPISAAS
jgi:hypothetical protein